MLSVTEARQRIFELLSPLPSETVSLSLAHQRVTASPLLACTTNPPSPVSSMDGYACKYEDLSSYKLFRIVDEIPAGSTSSVTLKNGECAKVFTGSLLPYNSNCVFMQEDAELSKEGTHVSFHQGKKATTGQYIRPAGVDFSINDILIQKGEKLTPRYIALAAAGNIPWVNVTVKPRIGILTTGNELVMPGIPPRNGQIINSNLFTLSAFISSAGGEAVMLPPLQDNEDDLINTLLQQNKLDLLITLGGASVGAYDMVKPALQKAGGEIEFWKIAMRPGKPLFCGKIQNIPVIGLPGNPVSAYVCSILFVLPAIAYMMGQTDKFEPLIEQGIITTDWPENNTPFLLHLRSKLSTNANNERTLTPFSSQDSSLVSVLKMSNALMLQLPFSGSLKAGSPCSFIDMVRLGL